MAAVHGKGGDVTFTGGSLDTTLASVTSWAFTSTGDVAESTGMGDSFAKFINGLTGFTATAECCAYTTFDVPTAVGAEATLTLQVSTGKTVAANAVLVSATETASIDDVGRLSLSFIGDATSVTYPA